MTASPRIDRYDVAIVGGALSGAATAIVLLQGQPDLRILIVERSTRFTRRVGEATVEVSGYFLGRVLGLLQHLNDAHIVKQGLRFWFANDETRTLEDCSEIGGRYLARVPGFQVDRAVLDEEILRRAVEAGAELWRPATVQSIVLESGRSQSLTVRRGEETVTVQARWVVDASGVAATLARQNGWWRANPAHPTASVWARWRGVKDWDGAELARKFPEWAKECYGIRGTATNHLVGRGWWAWMIPLKGGDVSVGLVFDQRLVEFPEGDSLGQRLKDFLCEHPAGRELLERAEWRESDVHWRRNLPYSSTRLAGDGFVLVGDAAGFIDPFYSPGLDWAGFTVMTSARLILAQQKGEALAPLIEQHNLDFARSYERWFESIYRGKYEYLGDYELMRVAFLLDLGLYYLGVAAQPFKRGKTALLEPLFSTAPSVPFFHFMRFYNRRLSQMARARRQRGTWGRHNARRRFMFGGYTFEKSSALPILKAVCLWARLELSEGWRTWFRPSRQAAPTPKPVGAPAAAPSHLL